MAGRRLSAEAETALFRVAQEALGNAHRHTGGSRVVVRLWESLKRHGGSIALTVCDDGRGPSGCPGVRSDDGDPAGFGVGLAGMRKRMRQLRGRLEIRAGTPTGTIVEASLPLVLLREAGGAPS